MGNTVQLPLGDDLTKVNIFVLGDLDERHVVLLDEASPLAEPCVAVKLNLPDGQVVVLEIGVSTLAALATAARAQLPDAFPSDP